MRSYFSRVTRLSATETLVDCNSGRRKDEGLKDAGPLRRLRLLDTKVKYVNGDDTLV